MAERKTLRAGDDLSMLQRLLARINIGGVDTGEEINKDLVKNLINLANSPQDFANNPARATGQTVRGAAEMVGRGAAAPLQALQPATEAVGQFAMGALNIDEKNLDPLARAGLKSVQKGQDQQIQDALAAGVPPEFIQQQILGRAGVGVGRSVAQGMADQRTLQPAQSPQVQQKVQPQTQTGEIDLNAEAVNLLKQLLNQKQPGVVGRFRAGALGALGIDPNAGMGATAQQKLAGISAVQELLGQKPMQAGEREASMLELGGKELLAQKDRMNKMFDNIMSPAPMSGELAKQMGLLSSANDSLGFIENVFNQDPGALANWSVPGNPLGQQIKFHTENLVNSLLRKESGAALTKDERGFMRSLLTPRGVKAMMEDPKTTAMKIKTIKEKINREIGFIQPNKGTADYIKAALQSGYTREEVMEDLMKRGAF